MRTACLNCKKRCFTFARNCLLCCSYNPSHWGFPRGEGSAGSPRGSGAGRVAGRRATHLSAGTRRLAQTRRCMTHSGMHSRNCLKCVNVLPFGTLSYRGYAILLIFTINKYTKSQRQENNHNYKLWIQDFYMILYYLILY